MRGKRAAVAVAGTGLVVAAVVGGVAARDGGAARSRPVTTDEAARLALSRLTSYAASPVVVEVEVPDGEARTEVRGLVDYRTGHAVGAYTSATGAAGLVAWDTTGLGVAPDGTRRTVPEAARAAETMPPAAWSARTYTTDPLDAALRVLMALGADRPDNAQLLARAGARWLRDERLDGGHVYGVFSGPLPREDADGEARLSYWVDADGNLRRFQLRVDGLARPVTVDLTGRRAPERVPATPWEVTGRPTAAPSP
ncbi:hypothetical protein ACIA8O_12750 [Kitasatospora sp. NPDC051853]|uniref:hypothetical protein n=1 Tax=Kitasatospora sp. NPDC051853 TaxID=3364058 RepID=UPI0037B65836